MEAAVVIIGIVALVAVGLSVFLLWKLISIQSASQGQDSAFGHQVGELRQDMGKVGDAIHQFGKEQSSQSVKLETILTTGLGPQLAALNANTGALREALANTQVRGQWGKRMAEGVFRIVGFVEQINYVKQATVADGLVPSRLHHLHARPEKANHGRQIPVRQLLEVSRGRYGSRVPESAAVVYQGRSRPGQRGRRT